MYTDQHAKSQYMGLGTSTGCFGKIGVRVLSMGKDFFLIGHMGSGTRAEEVWYKVLKTHIHSIFLTKESA